MYLTSTTSSAVTTETSAASGTAKCLCGGSFSNLHCRSLTGPGNDDRIFCLYCRSISDHKKYNVCIYLYRYQKQHIKDTKETSQNKESHKEQKEQLRECKNYRMKNIDRKRNKNRKMIESKTNTERTERRSHRKKWQKKKGQKESEKQSNQKEGIRKRHKKEAEKKKNTERKGHILLG